MKIKYIVCSLALLVSANAMACPSGTFSPNAKMDWMYSSKFNGVTFGASGSGYQSFSQTGTYTSQFFTNYKINVESWKMSVSEDGKTLFDVQGTGTQDLLSGFEKASSIFVPDR